MSQLWTIWPQLKISLLLDNLAPIMDNLLFLLLLVLFSIIHTLLIIRIIKWIIMYYSDLKESWMFLVIFFSAFFLTVYSTFLSKFKFVGTFFSTFLSILLKSYFFSTFWSTFSWSTVLVLFLVNFLGSKAYETCLRFWSFLAFWASFGVFSHFSGDLDDKRLPRCPFSFLAFWASLGVLGQFGRF